MSVTVLGAGVVESTLASLACSQHDTVLWAREPEIAEAVSRHHENPLFLPGFTLPTALRGTSDIAEAVADATVIVVVVPSRHACVPLPKLFDRSCACC